MKLAKFLLIFLFLSPEYLLAQTASRIETRVGIGNSSNNNGVAVADIDRDNDLDLFVVTRQNPNQSNTDIDSRLFLNNGNGTFTDISSSSGIQTSHDYSETVISWDFGLKTGASWGDFDNDGFPDLFLTNRYHLQLYKNNGNGTFTDITPASGINFSNNCYAVGATWSDYNNDSFLDLYITNWGSECGNIFYENNGNGTFTEKTQELGLQSAYLHGWMTIPIDINQDGWMDLYLANDYKDPNELFINNAGLGFSENASDYGLTNFDRDGMGIAVGDHNKDGNLEIFICNIDENSFYTSTGNNLYTDVSVEMNVHKLGWAWAAQFTDFDHDTDEDLFVTNGFLLETVNHFMKNSFSSGEPGFSDSNFEFGISEETESYGLVVFDYDNDGDNEILVSNVHKPLALYDNPTVDLAVPGQENWVKFRLEGTESNRDAVGSIVEIELNTGITLARYHHGSSFMGQSQQPVHFGLSDADQITSLTIKWPSGLIDTYTDLEPNKHYQITENTGISLLDIQSNKKVGCIDPNACNFDPEATIDNGSCNYLLPGNITGNSNPLSLSTESYSYPPQDGSSYEWAVENGIIIDGQGSENILVKWDIATSGRISVVEMRECVSSPAALEINFNLDTENDYTVARLWNEALLEAIRADFARPTVHARNLFHTSIAMYDAWAVFDENAETYLLGNRVHNYINDFEGFETSIELEEARNMAISYAAYQLLSHRFENSPGHEESQQRFDYLMELLGYDPGYDQSYYQLGNPAALGNYIAESIIEYGLIDGSGESMDYSNEYYEPVNPPLAVEFEGWTGLIDPNRWQPLQLRVFVDQSGNVISDSSPEFQSPEWGNVTPFSLKASQSTTYLREGNPYKVYFDPGAPPQLDTLTNTSSSDNYLWNFALVSIWGSHLDHTDGVMWDISPKGIGNLKIEDFPTDFNDFPDFYDMTGGGDNSPGRIINPITNEAYESQLVPRGDYARVLAEFWADGPDSETPPGHWFTILNYIKEHPQLEKRIGGNGSVLDNLEWDIKSYFILGGAMHDAAVAAWGVKGWYDYIRPVSAIRYMAERGQNSDPGLPNYDPGGITLVPGYIELIEEGDALANGNENVGKIKLYSWKGPKYIGDPSTDEAGVGWILANEWWPYQRPSFVTPPFAGYVSGHSTYSRAAAEILTLLTGSEYFPGGLGEFEARQNEFLVFEEGPSQDVVLQWATYRDAADQCSLSRIWGGIHPPADDIPGRIIGEKVGIQAFDYALRYFDGKVLSVNGPQEKFTFYPNPVNSNEEITVRLSGSLQMVGLFTSDGRLISRITPQKTTRSNSSVIRLPVLQRGIYILKIDGQGRKLIVR